LDQFAINKDQGDRAAGLGLVSQSLPCAISAGNGGTEEGFTKQFNHLGARHANGNKSDLIRC